MLIPHYIYLIARICTPNKIRILAFRVKSCINVGIIQNTFVITLTQYQQMSSPLTLSCDCCPVPEQHSNPSLFMQKTSLRSILLLLRLCVNNSSTWPKANLSQNPVRIKGIPWHWWKGLATAGLCWPLFRSSSPELSVLVLRLLYTIYS